MAARFHVSFVFIWLLLSVNQTTTEDLLNHSIRNSVLTFDLHFDIKVIIDNVIILSKYVQLQKPLRTERSIPVVCRSAQKGHILLARIWLDRVRYMLSGLDVIILIQKRQMDFQIEGPHLKGIVIALTNAYEQGHEFAFG